MPGSFVASSNVSDCNVPRRRASDWNAADCALTGGRNADVYRSNVGRPSPQQPVVKHA